MLAFSAAQCCSSSQATASQSLQRSCQARAVRVQFARPHARHTRITTRPQAGLGDLLNSFKETVAMSQAGQYDEAAVKSKVQKYIKDNPVISA